MSIACICCGDAIKPPENCTSFHYFRVCRPWKIIDEGKNACLVVRFFEKAVPLPLSPMPLRSAAAPRPPDISPCPLSSVEADWTYSRIVISTRLFFALPSRVVLSAMGLVAPLPRQMNLSASMPRRARAAAIARARSAESRNSPAG